MYGGGGTASLTIHVVLLYLLWEHLLVVSHLLGATPKALVVLPHHSPFPSPVSSHLPQLSPPSPPLLQSPCPPKVYQPVRHEDTDTIHDTRYQYTCFTTHFNKYISNCNAKKYTVYRVLNVCGKRMRDCEFLPHAQSFYAH